MNNDVSIFIANNADALRKLDLEATVEAEFGDEVVEGSQVTLAHHGSRSSNLPPCVQFEAPVLVEGGAIGVSHFDLDTLGGVMILLGYNPCAWDADRERAELCFWDLAAFVDVNGPHRLNDFKSKYSQEVVSCAVRWLRAFWAWSSINKVFAPRDGSSLDCTDFFHSASEIVYRLFNNDEELLKEGEEWLKRQEGLNEESFECVDGNKHLVVLRVSDKFVNHLYQLPDGRMASVVVALNTKFGSITVSRESDAVLFNCREFVQELWGPEAGGHDGIAGSPREKEFNFDDVKGAFVAAVKIVGE